MLLLKCMCNEQYYANPSIQIHEMKCSIVSNPTQFYEIMTKKQSKQAFAC